MEPRSWWPDVADSEADAWNNRGSYRLTLQGTNAHAVIAASEAVPEKDLSQACPWNRQRFWHCELPHAMLERCLPRNAGGLVEMHCLLQRPRLAYLLDCLVSPFLPFSFQTFFSSVPWTI